MLAPKKKANTKPSRQRRVEPSLTAKAFGIRLSILFDAARWDACRNLVDQAEAEWMESQRQPAATWAQLEAITVADLNLTTSTFQMLERHGIRNVGELLDRTAADLVAIPYFGARRLAEVRAAVKPLVSRMP